MRKAPLHSLLNDKQVVADVLREVLSQESTSSAIDLKQLERLTSGQESPAAGGPYTATEAIILKIGRPSLLIADSKWEALKPGALRDRLESARAGLEQAIPSVGRVEIVDASEDYVGTGWMLDEDVLVTNRHVAERFARRRGGVLSFLPTFTGQPQRVRVDFLHEQGLETTHQIAVLEVLSLEEPTDGQLDMALLRLDRTQGTAGLPLPIALYDRVCEFHEDVAAIGYPADDVRNDAYVMRSIFGKVYGVKRLSPGLISGVREDGMALDHDCSTLGGSSGSVLIHLASGKACGLHFRGTYLERNSAVTSLALKQRLAQLGRPLVSVPAPAPADAGSATTTAEARAPKRSPGPSAQDLADRQGYDPEFLGAGERAVPLPTLSAELQGQLAAVAERDDGELKYRHFSIKMRADRKLAFFTAVNIDGELLYGSPREADRWFLDPRLVDSSQQTDASLYAANTLDRGHLVRRLDPGWGQDRKEAEQAIGDTFFFTNCSPQHARLNQQTWLSLEEYVLKNAATQKLKVCVFSGPVFQEQDRSYRGVQIPEEYWKVVSIINDFTNRLSVTAYVISQANYLGDVEFAFGEFRTYQVPVSEIQARTGLDFGELLRHDPLAQIEGAPHREIRSGDDLLL